MNSDITNLTNLLRQNGDKVLNGKSKLSLNAKLLEMINCNFKQYFEAENSSTFQVIANSNINEDHILDLEFLHDFIQKTIGLRLSNNIKNNVKVDLSKFKFLKFLEIHKINIKNVNGLQHIRSHIQSIVCCKCLYMLEELLAECGGDNTSGFVWSELKEAVLSYNYIKVVDTSIAFAPWLQVLDLSHNQISDASAIECLPNLKYINLGYNCLEHVPVLNKSVRKRVGVLILKNNYIEDLNGLVGLDYLTEVDLSCNWLSRHDLLWPFLTMSALQWLSLKGNPLSYHSCHRINTVAYLHINAAFASFILDQKPLSKAEKPLVGTNLSSYPKSSSPIRLLPFVHESQPTSKRTDKNKKNKNRVPVIPNIDDGTIEDPPADLSVSSLIEISTEHLETKKQIETIRNKFGVENWLHSQAGNEVQDLLGIPSISSTPYDDVYRAAGSFQNTLVTTAVIEPQPPQVSENETHSTDMFVSCNTDNASMFYSMESKKEEEAHESKETSPDIEPIKESEDEEDENELIFLVQKEIKVGKPENKKQELFLTITDEEVKEKDINNGRTITKWCLSSLQSCGRLTQYRIQLEFDTIRRDKQERIYELEQSDSVKLYKHLTNILDARSWNDLNQIIYKCMQCSSLFSKEIKLSLAGAQSQCPTCQSKVIIEMDEAPLPTPEKPSITDTPKKRNTHNRSASMGTTQPDVKVTSSIGSAASLDELNELPDFQNITVKRSDSDIEILSNPSQSSIEVIDGPNKIYGGNTPRRKRSSEERQTVVQASLIVPEIVNPPNTGLTESSSSGSVTDSVCTAYENNSSMVNSSVSRVSTSDICDTIEELPMKEDLSAISDQKLESPLHSLRFTNMLEGVLETVNSKLQHDSTRVFKRISDTVSYSYTDFTCIDHRIKLFIYLNVLEEENEDIICFLRGSIVLETVSVPFEGCIVFSNKRIYILKVVGREEGDDALNFLQKLDLPYTILKNLVAICPLFWSQGLSFKFTEPHNKFAHFLILLKDKQRTKNFVSFIQNEDLISNKFNGTISNRPNLALQQTLVSTTDSTTVKYLSTSAACTITEDTSERHVTNIVVVITDTDIILLDDSVKWLFEHRTDTPNVCLCQKISNLMQVECQDNCVDLHFLNEVQGKEESWSLSLETQDNVCELIETIRIPWEELFSVPLHVSDGVTVAEE